MDQLLCHGDQRLELRMMTGQERFVESSHMSFTARADHGMHIQRPTQMSIAGTADT